jgi:hypothetical protein
VELVHDLDLDELLPWLQGEGILSRLDQEKIEGEKAAYEQKRILLDILQTKPEEQLEIFIQGLIECNQIHLAKLIDPNSKLYYYYYNTKPFSFARYFSCVNDAS